MGGHGKPPDDGKVARDEEDNEVIDMISSTLTDTSRAPGPDVEMDEVAPATDQETRTAEEANTVHEEETAEELTFAEMSAYLRSEITGLDLTRVKAVVSAVEYAEALFAEVFNARPKEPLPADRNHYPELTDEEGERMLQFLLAHLSSGRSTERQWRAAMHDLARSIYKAQTRSLLKTLDHRIAELQVKAGPTSDPWSQKLISENDAMDNDVEMTGSSTSSFRFLRKLYSPQEIAELRDLCEAPFGFSALLRKPKESEQKVIRGLLEGSILCEHLPEFLKRICNNASQRVIQNTIKAQVEGDLVLLLQPDFPVYPDFQTRERLIGMILLGVGRGGYDKTQVVAMLRETKQVCYDEGRHAVHLIFWTRELATKWSAIFHSLPFQSRRFPLQNEHPAVPADNVDPKTRAALVWARQVGTDGIRDEQPRERYHVRLLNVSRFLNESALDAFIQGQFHGSYTTWQEPSSKTRKLQTDTWDVYFKNSQCPKFLSGMRFIDWAGHKILVQHASRSRAPPCFKCGASGHTRNQCNVPDDYWKQHHCVTVTTAAIAQLPHQASTITSIKKLEKYWIEEKESPPTPPPVVAKAPTSTVRLLTRPPEKPASSPRSPSAQRTAHQPNGQWITAGSPRAAQHLQDQVERTISNETKVEAANAPEAPRKPSAETVGRSISEEIQGRKRHRTAAMEKHQRLIESQIAAKHIVDEQGAVGNTTALLTEKPMPALCSGERVLQHCKLEPVATPKTGNCQFADKSSVPALENLTSKIKKGMWAAVSHYFEQEFPHDIREAILSSLDEGVV